MSQFSVTNDIIMDNIVVDEKGHNVVNGSFAHKPDSLLFYFVKLPQHHPDLHYANSYFQVRLFKEYKMRTGKFWLIIPIFAEHITIYFKKCSENLNIMAFVQNFCCSCRVYCFRGPAL